MCMWCLLSCFTILFVLYMWWMFCHDRIAILKKDEIKMTFTNSCNHRILIVVEWVCQSKVPSSIIMNGVSVGHLQAQYWFTHQSIENRVCSFRTVSWWPPCWFEWCRSQSSWEAIDDELNVSCLILAIMSLDLQKQYEHVDAYTMIQGLRGIFQNQARV
jgi:hypothetical protein